MSDTQKITAHVPKELLESAMAATGEGITETVKKGFEMLARQQAYATLLSLQGKVDLKLDLKSLREDREF